MYEIWLNFVTDLNLYLNMYMYITIFVYKIVHQ